MNKKKYKIEVRKKRISTRFMSRFVYVNQTDIRLTQIPNPYPNGYIQLG